MPTPFAEVAPFAVSLALGALIGVERERSRALEARVGLGGVRTFPLVGLFGCATAWAGTRFGPFAFVVFAAGFFALVVASYVISSLRGTGGTTTALASLLTFAFGVMVHQERAALAGALAVATTIILSLKKRLHEFTSKIEEEDLFATLKLAALTVVILPWLPDRPLGPPPYDVVNPYRISLLVGLIASIGFIGYVGTKLLGPGRGIAVAGALGGIVSSTALTVSFSNRSKESPELSPAFALGIAIAWGAMLLRVLAMIAILNPGLVLLAAPPLVAAAGATVVCALILHRRAGSAAPSPRVPYRNPFSVLAAIRFGVLLTAIFFVAKVAQLRFQEPGVLGAAAISGFVDVEPIVVTAARLSGSGEMSGSLAVLAISVAICVNTISKTVIASLAGSPELGRALVPTTIATLGSGALALFATARG